MGYGIGIGIVTIMILFGIIVSGTFMEASKDTSNIQYYNDYNILPPNFDNILQQIDENVTLQIDTQFADTNLSPGFKQTIHYITKGVIYGIYTDIYMGKTINEYTPGLYSWIKENMVLVVAIIILLVYPQIVSLIIICLFALLLMIKERFFDKNYAKKNTWRDFKPAPIIQQPKSIFSRLFRPKKSE